MPEKVIKVFKEECIDEFWQITCSNMMNHREKYHDDKLG